MTEEPKPTKETWTKLDASYVADKERTNYAREVSTSEAMRKRVLAASNGHSSR